MEDRVEEPTWSPSRGPPPPPAARRPPCDCFPEAGIACQAPLTHHPLRPHFAELSVGPSVPLPILAFPLLDAAVSSGPVASPAQSVSDRE